MQTLGDVLANGRDDDLILEVTEDGARFTRKELQELVASTAFKLKQEHGIGAGQAVALAMANTLEFVASFFAITSLRAIVAPLNAGYTVDEFHFYLESTASSLLLLPSEGNPAAETAAAQLSVPVATLQVDQHSKTAVLLKRASSKSSLASPAQHGRQADPGVVQPSDIAMLSFTSGSTGRPKTVPLAHANMVASVINIIGTYELTPFDASYLVMPLFHVHGLFAGFLAPLGAGGRVVLPTAGRFSASVFWQDCCAHRISYYTAVPTIHQILLARAATDYPSASPPPLRFIRSCSSALAPATLERLVAAFGVPVLEAYAMTEASHQMTSNPLPRHGPAKPGTVGRAQGSVQVAVLDDKHRLLPVGELGEVCIRGPTITPGYANNPKANEEAFAGGWFHTGDQGRLDEEGYLTLTSRIKELINRGGEKISPVEVDRVLLAHPAVGEAVAFGLPDEKYGEIVAAAIVLRSEARTTAPEKLEADILELCRQRLASFKIPTRLFITDSLPKTATGKIQRKQVAAVFSSQAQKAVQPSAPPQQQQQQQEAFVSGIGDGNELVARALADHGVRYVFGVAGIPVTALCSSLQAAGIRFIGMRNEQAAGYAAAAAGFLTSKPAALLTVAGPGVIHGLAGISHAAVNGWPLLTIAGSSEQAEVGRGAFQEYDQLALTRPFCRFSERITAHAHVRRLVGAAVAATTAGVHLGPAYLDLPADVLLSPYQQSSGIESSAQQQQQQQQKQDDEAQTSSIDDQLRNAAQAIRSAHRPLIVVGAGAALRRTEDSIRALADLGFPVLGTSMGRGLLPDDHSNAVHAARSFAMRTADLVVLVGAPLNWQLGFGDAPSWAKDVAFVLVLDEPTVREQQLARFTLPGRCDLTLRRLLVELANDNSTVREHARQWLHQLQARCRQSVASLAQRLSAAPVHPLDYYTTMSVIRACLSTVEPPPVVCSEGANTMDMARLCLPVTAPRTRIDAAVWGTMGVGLGAAIAAAVVTDHLVVAVEGDSAFGFSGMECETIARYQLPIVVIVFENGGIYGGDRRPDDLQRAASSALPEDPAPTSFAPGCRYDLVMQGLGGKGFCASNATELREACEQAFSLRKPALINVVLDPFAGTESGRMHAKNALSAKL